MIHKHRVIPTILLYIALLLTSLVWDVFTANEFGRNEWISGIGVVFTMSWLHMAATLITILFHQEGSWFRDQDDAPEINIHNNTTNVGQASDVVGRDKKEA